MKTVTYVYRGDIERVVKRWFNYVWFRGYSAVGSTGGVLYPWLTKTECRADAKTQNSQALFKEEQ